MLVALQIGGALPRRHFEFFRRPRETVAREWVRVGEGRYLRLTAFPNWREDLDWEAIREQAGQPSLLLPIGVHPPKESGIYPAVGTLLGQELMAVTAVHLLRSVSCRLPVAVYDAAARMRGLPAALLPYAKDVRVVTARPAFYRAEQEQAMKTYGAVFSVSADPAALNGVSLLLAPAGLEGLTPHVRGWVLCGVAATGKNVVGGYVPCLSPAWLQALPAGCDPWAFLAAIYEWGGLRNILTKPPVALCVNGKNMPFRDAVWKIASLTP